MKLFTDISLIPKDKFVATVGFFDGVHLGHRFLLQKLKNEALALGRKSLVITFDKHPRTTVCPDFHLPLLSTNDEKITLLSDFGIDGCVFLPFDKAMANLSAYEFLSRIILEQMGVRHLLVGYDHRFGKNREENFDDYVRYGKELGINIIRADVLDENHIRVSSSVIRKMLLSGRVQEANKLLAHPYEISGKVISGEQLGRKLGFPTANIELDNDLKLIPSNGVYAALAVINNRSYKGMVNIGTRPTVSHSKQRSIEVNIIDFNEDIYNKNISLHFIEKIRDEFKFNSKEELISAMETDKKYVLQLKY